MKKRSIKTILSLLLGLVMAVSSLAGCGSSDAGEDTAAITESTVLSTEPASSEATESSQDPAPGAETVVIRYGTHWQAGMDPYYVDDVTGEYTVGEAERQASLAALDKIKEELNVEFEFVQYSSDTRTELMTSVLAGDPICDIAVIWGGGRGYDSGTEHFTGAG